MLETELHRLRQFRAAISASTVSAKSIPAVHPAAGDHIAITHHAARIGRGTV